MASGKGKAQTKNKNQKSKLPEDTRSNSDVVDAVVHHVASNEGASLGVCGSDHGSNMSDSASFPSSFINPSDESSKGGKTIRVTRNDPYGTYEPELYTDSNKTAHPEVHELRHPSPTGVSATYSAGGRPEMPYPNGRVAPRPPAPRQINGIDVVPSTEQQRPMYHHHPFHSNQSNGNTQAQQTSALGTHGRSAQSDYESHLRQELMDRVGPDLCRVLCEAYAEAKMTMPSSASNQQPYHWSHPMHSNSHPESGECGVPTSDEILYHEAYYLSRVLYLTSPPFAVAVFQALQDNTRRLFPAHVVEDVLQYVLSFYPTSIEQFRLLLHPHAIMNLFKQYSSSVGMGPSQHQHDQYYFPMMNEVSDAPYSYSHNGKNSNHNIAANHHHHHHHHHASNVNNGIVNTSANNKRTMRARAATSGAGQGNVHPQSGGTRPLPVSESGNITPDEMSASDPNGAFWTDPTHMFPSGGVTLPTVHGRTSLWSRNGQREGGEHGNGGPGVGPNHGRGGFKDSGKGNNTTNRGGGGRGRGGKFSVPNEYTNQKANGPATPPLANGVQVAPRTSCPSATVPGSEESPAYVPAPYPTTPLDEEAMKELENFLTAVNLLGLFPQLCEANMGLHALRSIPLGRIHEDLTPCVANRALRQRLIDSLHSTIDPRASHKEKQGMWLHAREEGRTVYIRGLQDLTDYVIRSYLNYHHGEVVDMRYMFDPRSSTFLGYGFVMFRDSSAVDSILRRSTYHIGDGYTVQVKCSDTLLRP